MSVAQVFRDILARAKLRVCDRILYSSLLRSGYVLVLVARAQWLSRQRSEKLLLLSTAYRRCPPNALRRVLERMLSPWLDDIEHATIWREEKIGVARYRSYLASNVLTKSLLLKQPGPNGEKGALYVSFEYNWARLLKHVAVEKLLADYLLVLSSTNSPTSYEMVWALANSSPHPLLLQISNPLDHTLYRRFGRNLVVLPIMASDWINPGYYDPKPHADREIDILVVARWSRQKRHWLLFQALQRMRRDLRVVLIGQDDPPRTASHIREEARLFGVANQIEVISNVAPQVVSQYQCNSRTSVIPTAREGACVVVAEALFANTPVAMMENAYIGTKAYINPRTGVLLRRHSMAWQLSKLIEESYSYAPREWADAQGIDCFRSSAKLNEILREYCVSKHLPWTRDITPLCMRPDPVYVDRADAGGLMDGYEYLRQHYHLEFGEYRTNRTETRP